MQFFSSLIHVIPDRFSIEEITSLLRTVTAKAAWLPPPGAQASPDELVALYLWSYLRQRSYLLAELAENPPNTVTDMLERCERIIAKIGAFIPKLAHCGAQPTDTLTEEEFVAAKTVLQYALEQGRCLGCTKGGRFYNAANTVQEGDAIVALQGADQLFVIRPLRNGYKLIGDIFVDGLMHGEAYKNQGPAQVDYDIELI